MKIIVKNKDPMRAYKKLMKILNNDGWSKDIKAKEFYVGPAKKARLKHIRALSRMRKDKLKQEKLQQKYSRNQHKN